MLVDQPISFALWIALVVQFFLWIYSVDSWGKILAENAGLKSCPMGVRLALGSLFYALLALLLAWMGLLYPPMRYFLFILQSLAIAWAPRERIRLEKETLIALLPLALLLFLNTIDGLVIHPYWDPLHHHLVGARQFWENGRMYFPQDSIASYQEGGFELLFLWPHYYFGKAGGLGLLPVQIFAQLTHVVLGFGGSVLLAYAIVKSWLPKAGWQILAVTMFAISGSLQFAIPTAKNDWGIVLWVLAGFWILSSIPLAAEMGKSPRKIFSQLTLAGLFWGFAFLGKLSSGFAIAGLAVIVFFRPRGLKEIAFLSAGFLLGGLPLALRNFGATGDPFFPLLSNIFPIIDSAMGPTWRQALATYQENPIGIARMRELFTEFPLAPAALLAPLIALRKKEVPSLRAASIAFLIALLLFSFIAGKATELRLVGSVLPLAGLLATVVVFRLSQRMRLPVAPTSWILLSILVVFIPFRWSAISRMPTLPHAHELTRAYISGEAQGWIRDHFKPGMRAGLLADSRIYHSLPLPIVRLWDAPEIDRRLRACRTGPEFVKVLHELGFTHLILSQEKLDLFYPKELVGVIEAYVLPLSDTHVFTSAHSVVADVDLLLSKSQ